MKSKHYEWTLWRVNIRVNKSKVNHLNKKLWKLVENKYNLFCELYSMFSLRYNPESSQDWTHEAEELLI